MSANLNRFLLTPTQDYISVTEEGEASRRYLKNLIRTLRNPGSVSDKDVEADIKAMNDRLRYLALSAHGLVAKDLTLGDVQTTEVLQNLSVMYANDEYIGLRLMPVVEEANGTSAAVYWKKQRNFSAPSDRISPKGEVNKVSEGFERDTITLEPRALKETLDANVKAGMDNPVADLINPLVSVVDGLALNQERRIVKVTTTPASFGSNTTAIAALDRWDTETGGDPGGVVDAAKDELWKGNTPSRVVGVCSTNVFNVLKRHPTIRDQFKYTGRDTLTRQMLAEYFDIDELLVGRVRENTANENQAAVWERLWPDVFGLFSVPQVPAKKVATFGLTLKTPTVEQEWFENGTGGWGVFNTQVAYMDAHPVVCADCGYLITTPIGS